MTPASTRHKTPAGDAGQFYRRRAGRFAAGLPRSAFRTAALARAALGAAFRGAACFAAAFLAAGLRAAGAFAAAFRGDRARPLAGAGSAGNVCVDFTTAATLPIETDGARSKNLPMSAISKRGFEAVVNNNLTGGFLMMREVYNQSMAKHGGAVVNMTADMWNGMPGMAHSGAARAGMANLTKTAAYEWAASHVRVNAVAPGWIASSGMDAYGPGMAPMIRMLKDNLPAKRLGLEAEVSSVICFLLSPGAAFVTGITVAIDGGAPLHSPVMPTPNHAGAPTYDGFHRAAVPAVLKPEAQ